MNILGVHIGHDSSAALIKDGVICSDVAEERFTRIKHYSGLPIQAINYCLDSQGLTIKDIDYIAIPTSINIPELNFLFDLKGDKQEKKTHKRKIYDFVRKLQKAHFLKPPLYIKSFPIRNKTEIVHIDHHLSHAASAYYTCGLSEKQLIITMDGAGDGYSVCVWRGENGKIVPLKKFPTNASLGWFYSTVTEALGWWHGDGEGKTMGLAPYGDYTKVKGLLDAYYPKFSNGALIESCNFGQVYYWNEGSAFQWHFDSAYEINKLIKKYGREHIAAEAQRILEVEVKKIIYPWLDKENTQNLNSAGGIFLNVKLNQRIWESGKVENYHIYPNAGDSGLAVGAALYLYHQLEPGMPSQKLEHLYWGNEYSDKEIEEMLKLRNISYRRLEGVEEFIAQKLAEDKIVGWFQGRMESGPRGLGARSILMSANKSENKDIINSRVKFREAFRPFCPSIIWEKKEDYLENPRNEFFMISSFTCKKEKRNKVPAVVHADYSLRPQMVKKETNPRFWKLISEFGKITGEYVVLNTSFNIMGEPIINHPREAIKCFYDNGLDYLVLGNLVLSKRG